MKGLPRAIVLGLLSGFAGFAGEGKEQPVPSGPRHGASAYWEWHCQAPGRTSASEMRLPTEAGSPGLKY